MVIDHLILSVNDVDESIRFYRDLLGLAHEGESGPFQVIRVSPDFTVLLAPWGTKLPQHLAFAMARSEFDAVFARMREQGVAFGDHYHDVENGKAPGREDGARGPGATIYMNDPSRHLIEIRHYED